MKMIQHVEVFKSNKTYQNSIFVPLILEPFFLIIESVWIFTLNIFVLDFGQKI